MRILAAIPTGKITGPTWTQFTDELMEVEVVRVIRYRADRFRYRYYYHADVIAPESLHPDYPLGTQEREKGIIRVRILRDKNPKWKPSKEGWWDNVLEVKH